MKEYHIKVPPSLDRLTPTQLGELLAVTEEIVKLNKTVKAFAVAHLKAGKPVHGYHLGDGKRSREWLSDNAAKEAMAAQGINDFYKPQELLSVAEAEKKVADAEQLEVAWKWVPGSKTLKAGPAPVSSTKPDFGF